MHIRTWVGIALSFAGYILYDNGQLAWLTPGSKLGMFDTKIRGAASELMRRSPALHDNFEMFRRCEKDGKGHCLEQVTTTRQALVTIAWPGVFDHLIVDKDWYVCDNAWEGCEDVTVAHDAFIAQLAKVGPAKLRDSCVPVLTYTYGSDRHTTYDAYEYQCWP